MDKSSTTDFTLGDNVENLTLVDGDFRTEDFENFTTGPIADGENGWNYAGTSDQTIVDVGGNKCCACRAIRPPARSAGPIRPRSAPRRASRRPRPTSHGQVIRFEFKAVDPVADNSRLEVDFGNAAGTDRNNFMVIESIEGSGIRIAVNEPTTTINQWRPTTSPASPATSSWSAGSIRPVPTRSSCG